MNILIGVKNRDDEVIAHRECNEDGYLVVNHNYELGDYIEIISSVKTGFLEINLDDTLGRQIVYVTDGMIRFTIPFEQDRVCYSPRAFMGNKHLITARIIVDEEVNIHNLAHNVYDQKRSIGTYPHASATVETRGEASFEARNAIDGLTANDYHGEWPYSLWGINRDLDAKWKVDFGRDIEISKIVLFERADFPHDNWWKNITIRFSDDTIIQCDLLKTDKGQEINIDSKLSSFIQLESLIQSDEPSPFPALTQVEVY